MTNFNTNGATPSLNAGLNWNSPSTTQLLFSPSPSSAFAQALLNPATATTATSIFFPNQTPQMPSVTMPSLSDILLAKAISTASTNPAINSTTTTTTTTTTASPTTTTTTTATSNNLNSNSLTYLQCVQNQLQLLQQQQQLQSLIVRNEEKEGTDQLRQQQQQQQQQQLQQQQLEQLLVQRWATLNNAINNKNTVNVSTTASAVSPSTPKRNHKKPQETATMKVREPSAREDSKEPNSMSLQTLTVKVG